MNKQPAIQNPEKTAVIYARYSSHNQRDVSIEQQVEACRRYAEQNDLTVLRVYDDHAMTGTNDNRPEFRQMILDSASRAFSFVIVYTLDRFSRDRYDSAIHKHTLKENGVKVLSAMENIQDNPVGVLMESVLEGFAEYYSKELAQKIRRGMRSNAEKCMVNGPLPFGYKKGEDGRYEILPAEAEIVREIYQRTAEGESFSKIREDLNARGIPTKGGGQWNKASFSKLLHQEKYLGIYTSGDIRIEDGIPAIISRDLFAQVQERCKTKPNPRHTPKGRRRESGVYLLTGKLFCGECKNPMVGVSGTGKMGKLYAYYVCKAVRTKEGPACSKKPIARDLIEEAVARKIREILSRDDVAEKLADMTLEYINSEHESEELAILKDRLESVRKEKENTLKAIRMGVIAKSVQEMLQQLEADESSLKARLSLAESQIKDPPTKDMLLAFIESFRDGDIKDKKYQEALFDAFLVRAFVYDDRFKIVFTVGQDTEEAEVPFDIDEAENIADQVVEIGDSGNYGELECSYRVDGAPPSSPYTNFLYMVRGMFVAAGALIARRKNG